MFWFTVFVETHTRIYALRQRRKHKRDSRVRVEPSVESKKSLEHLLFHALDVMNRQKWLLLCDLFNEFTELQESSVNKMSMCNNRLIYANNLHSKHVGKSKNCELISSFGVKLCCCFFLLFHSPLQFTFNDFKLNEYDDVYEWSKSIFDLKKWTKNKRMKNKING